MVAESLETYTILSLIISLYQYTILYISMYIINVQNLGHESNILKCFQTGQPPPDTA